MTISAATELALNALIITGKVAGPMLLVALMVGVFVGVMQAATQINEASISFVLKLLAVGATIVVLGSWTMRQLVDYTQKTIESASHVVR